MKIREISISLWAAIGAIILAPTVALLICANGTRLPALWQWVFVLVFAITPLAAGATHGFYDKSSLNARSGLLLCFLLLAAAVALTVLAFVHDRGLLLIWPIAIVSAAILNGFLAGIFTGRIRTEKSKPKCRHLVVCWLAGPLCVGLFCAYLTLCRKIPDEGVTYLTTPFYSLPFGPYATLVAKNGDWPNAGEFFFLWVAVLLTLLMLLPAAWFLLTKNRTVASLVLIVFATASTASLIVGFWQLLGCAS